MTDPRPFCPPDTPPRWIRARGFRIPHVALDIAIDLDARLVSGTVTHRVEFLAHGAGEATLTLDRQDVAIEAVTIDGVAATFSLGAGGVQIALPTPRPGACNVALRFRTSAPIKGLYFIAEDAARQRVAMAWTQGAMEDHHHWFPCFDDPNNLSTYRIAIRHRTALVAVANGVRERRSDHGDGWSTTVFVQDQPHVLYLLNVAVGDFVAVDDVTAPVPVTHWLPRGHQQKSAAMFRSTAFAIRWLGDFIGVPFAWSRYGHLVVHGFMWGGMENTTLTTITDRVLMDGEDQRRDDLDCDSLVVHELVHQWFGDLLTMKAWADIWLNESFATYLEARGTAAWCAQGDVKREADELARELWANREAYLSEDKERYRRPLVTNRFVDAYELFDRVAYEKGSLVLHHLCRVLGEERFRATLKLYVTRHRHDLVESDDWRQAIEDATGEAMDWFVEQSLRRGGHPVLKVRHRHDPARGQVLVEIEQVQAAGDAAQVYRLPVALAWQTIGGVVQRRDLVLDRARETVVVPCAEALAWVVLDPDGHLPVEWDEDGETMELLARAGADVLDAQARARAMAMLGSRHATPALVDGLRALIAAAHTPELVVSEAIAALGKLRDPQARDALIALYDGLRPRLRRAVASALGRQRGDAIAAEALIALGDCETSPLSAGECFAARGATEHPGAVPLLRARSARPSWNHLLRAACVRGLGDSGEAAAIDDCLVMVDASEHEAVRLAACGALGGLGSRHLLARDRVRRALEPLLDDASMHVRSATAKAIARLGDPAGRAALAQRRDREPFGNVQRVLRESLDHLATAAAAITASAELGKRIDELEAAKKKLDARLEALEKRLG